MSITFVNPKALTNQTSENLCSQFSNGDPANPLNLTSTSCQLGGNQTFNVAGCRNCSPTTFGAYYPEVADQSELNDNYGQITISGVTAYLFLKEDENSEFVLMTTDDLSSGYDNCSAVMLYENGEPTSTILATDLPTVTLEASLSGGILIIGVIDDGADRN